MPASKKMTPDQLVTFLDNEEKDALGYSWGTLQSERAAAMDFYFARPFGNEKEGRSDIVSTQVFDTVEWVLPQLISIFASTDKAVEFEPQGPEDAEGAKQATETCNYVFWRQNPGFLILYSWFKDALIQKNGLVKWGWVKKTEKTRKKYPGVTVEMIAMLMEREGVEIISKTEYPDPVFSVMLARKIAEAQASGQPLPPQMPQPPMVYDIEVEVTQEAGKVGIYPVPPEEFIVSRRHNSLILDDAPFCAHVRQVTLSELRSMGYEFDDDDDEINRDSPTWLDWSVEKLARMSKNEDGTMRMTEDNSTDPSQKLVWCREIYCHVDTDGDGIAEKRRIVRAGNKVMENELCEHVQIAGITPIIITHRFFGMSWAEMVMDLQFLCTTIWRQMLDNLFHANNQSHIVLSTADGRVQANIDDLLDSRPGRVMREYQPNAIRHEETPWVAAQSFPMLDYIDQQRLNRTGTNYLSSGLDADSINKTARGAQLASNMMHEKVELVARIFAEGVKEMFKGVRYMLSKYQSRPLMFRLRNEFVNYDPSDWKSQYDMSINVGIGTGNKDQQLGHLATIAQDQMMMLQTPLGAGLVSPMNVYNVRARITENAGFKNVAEFWTEPKDNKLPPPPQPQPDPIAMAEVKIKEQGVKVQEFDALTRRMAAMHGAQPQLPEQAQPDPIKNAEVQVKGFEAETHRMVAETGRMQAMQAETGAAEAQNTAKAVSTIDQKVDALLQQTLRAQQQILTMLAALARPKRKVPVRDPKTREIIHVDEVAVEQEMPQ